ncbi:CHASE2 domain-containing protein [Gayadomonas joobiniege]|uniref:CHASE2 domain-containing protein n=1 Tax=Gayadomonas joobiniege TaxID=1234606 RepID=UPI00037754B1|nr:adenylate/guanylate cyclase domain-containing protein [Gayadomonas joobiniege]
MPKLSFKHTSVLAGLLLSGLVCTLQLLPESNPIGNQIARVDAILYDLRFNLLLSPRPESEQASIAVVDIDEKSIRAEGRFPWSRSKLAQLIEHIFASGAAVVAVDIMLTEKERNPVRQILLNTNDPELTSQLKKLEKNFDADYQLSQTFQLGDIVLGGLFEDDALASAGVLPNKTLTLSADVPIKQLSIQNKAAYVGITPTLAAAAKQSHFDFSQGYINSSPDADGSIRRASLVMRYEDQLYASLALAAVRAYQFIDQIQLQAEPYANYYNITGLMLDQTWIPTDEQARILIPYRGQEKSFPYFSATDLIQQPLVQSELIGAIVFIGTSSVGLADLRETPVGLQFPGVEVHANVAEALLLPHLIKYQPDMALQLSALFILLVGMLLSVLMPRLEPLSIALIGIFGVALVIAVNLAAWYYLNLVFPLLLPLSLVLLLTVCQVGIGYFTENNQKKMIKNFFRQYVPPAHIDKMLAAPEKVSFAGERKELTVLFSDIRSFTNISESLSANQLKQLLNEYFSPVTKTILNHKGTIDKYVGDMVMAFWGAPLDDQQHAQNAVKAALEIQQVSRQLSREFSVRGWPAVKVGIGLNTGEMNVGDMGSEFRRAYTVLGDAVNLGSRLESLTKYYGVDILVSGTCQSLCPDIIFRPIDKVKVKGKQQAVFIYQPIGSKDQVSIAEMQELSLHQQAYQDYLAKRFCESELKFRQLQAEFSPRLVYDLMITRTKHYQQQPPDASWDGSYTHTQK